MKLYVNWYDQELLTKEELDELLRPENMIAPHKMPHKKY